MTFRPQESSVSCTSRILVEEVVQWIAGLINHRVTIPGGGLYRGVPQELAEGVDGLPGMGCISVAQDVGRDQPIEFNLLGCDLNCTLNAFRQ